MGKRKTPINWKTYNKELVNRGKNVAMFLKAMTNSDVLESELEQMNDKKNGRPYKYPDSLIIFLYVLKAITSKSYRFLEGYCCMFLDKSPEYSVLFKRVNKLSKETMDDINRKVIAAASGSRTIEVILDATGLQVNGTYVWIDEKYNEKRKRKWKKIHLVIDANTRAILSANVLGKNKNEGEHNEFSKSLKKASYAGKITKVYADGAYDSKANFMLCEKTGIKPVIRIRKPTVKKVAEREKLNKRLILHKRPLFKFDTRDKRALKQSNWHSFVDTESYGKRSGIEGVIGSVKRFFGEHLNSKKDEYIEREIAARVMTWNIMVC
jgi:transposase